MPTQNLSTVFLAAAVTVFATAGPCAELSRDSLDSTAGPILIHPFEHASFVMEWNGKTVYVDPVGDAEQYSAMPPADLILLTHAHGDHTSAETLAVIASERTEVVAPAVVSEKLGEAAPGGLTIVATGETYEHHGITVEAVPAYNLTEDRLKFHPKDRRDNGYVVTMGGTRIYISGDTEDIPEMRSLKSIDVAFVCMNLPYTMTVEAAADAVLEFAPKVVYPYHYRGPGGMSDLDAFRKLVGKNPAIEVRLLRWYQENYVWLDADGQPLPFQSHAAILEAMQTATVVESKLVGRGVAGVIKLTLEHEDVRFHAAFRTVDIRKREKTGSARMMIYYRDHYIFEVAAYEVSEMLGLGRVPPTTQRTVNGTRGSVQIWVEGSTPEDKLLETGPIEPPDTGSWWRQKETMWVFDSLIANVDRNQGNLLIDDDWTIWFIDHSRSFRETSSLLEIEKIERCDRRLYQALMELDEDAFRERLGALLESREIARLAMRRTKLVKHIKKKIKKDGAEKALFDLP